MHLLDEFEQRRKVKIISFAFGLSRHGSFLDPEGNERIRNLSSGIWLNHIPAM